MYHNNVQKQLYETTVYCNNGQRQNEKLHDMNYVVRFFQANTICKYFNIGDFAHTVTALPQQS